MKLEVGKTYLDRCGENRSIVSWTLHDGFIDRQGRKYSWDGRCAGHAVSFDLVAEAPPEGAKVVTEWSATGSKVDNPIPHADLIRAVLDGKVVQYLSNHKWEDLSHEGFFRRVANDELRRAIEKFRIKPRPPAVFWLVATADHIGPDVQEGAWSESQARIHAKSASQPLAKVLRLELDPDTLDLINARTEEP